MTDLKNGGNPKYNILYVSPEKLASNKKLLNGIEIAHGMNKLDLIVIDEAHCTSQWGHDFRPKYKNLGILRSQFPGVPILACTATATTAVLKDTIKILS